MCVWSPLRVLSKMHNTYQSYVSFNLIPTTGSIKVPFEGNMLVTHLSHLIRQSTVSRMFISLEAKRSAPSSICLRQTFPISALIPYWQGFLYDREGLQSPFYLRSVDSSLSPVSWSNQHALQVTAKLRNRWKGYPEKRQENSGVLQRFILGS
jgi:hypothetical protein